MEGDGGIFEACVMCNGMERDLDGTTFVSSLGDV